MAAIIRTATAIRARAGMLVLAGLVSWLAAIPLRAAPADALYEALRIDDMLSVMRDEGKAYGRELGQDLFAGGTSPRWDALLDEIYDPAKMRDLVRRDFAAALAGTDTAPLVAFFTAQTGQRIVGLELEAREAMIEDAVEEAARERFRQLETASDAARLDQVTRFIAANDLLEANVAGALNASFRFYRGLVDGGGFQMSEQEILSDVWAQEEETREDTREWLYAFLLLAYEPLEDDTLDAYIALSATPEGRALNRALFAAFNRMYDEISYALGLAAAQQMQGQDL